MQYYVDRHDITLLYLAHPLIPFHRAFSRVPQYNKITDVLQLSELKEGNLNWTLFRDN